MHSKTNKVPHLQPSKFNSPVVFKQVTQMKSSDKRAKHLACFLNHPELSKLTFSLTRLVLIKELLGSTKNNAVAGDRC